MKLAVYLAKRNITVAEFAKSLRICRPYLSSIKWGRKIPSRKVIHDIKRMTEGLVDLKAEIEVYYINNPHERPREHKENIDLTEDVITILEPNKHCRFINYD